MHEYSRSAVMTNFIHCLLSLFIRLPVLSKDFQDVKSTQLLLKQRSAQQLFGFLRNTMSLKIKAAVNNHPFIFNS